MTMLSRRRFFCGLPLLPLMGALGPSPWREQAWREWEDGARMCFTLVVTDGTRQEENTFAVWAGTGRLTAPERERARQMAREALGAWLGRKNGQPSGPH